MKNEEDNIMNVFKLAAFAILGIIIAVALLTSVVTIPAGNRGILLTWGQVTGTLGEGLHFTIPFMQSVQPINIQTAKYETDASAASKDLQLVNTKIAVNYHIPQTIIQDLYTNVGLGYESRVIQPAIQEAVKASTAQFSAEQLITRRADVKDKITLEVRERLSKYGFELESVSITNFDFSAQFNAAIDAKVTAEQNALKAKNDLDRIKLEAEQQIATATAEAEGLRIQNEELKNSDKVLVLRWIEKWDGHLPQFMSSDSKLLIGLNQTLGGN